MRPGIGDTVLLVYRECPCGWWCATGEGSSAPICPHCSKMALPLGGLAPDLPEEDRERLGRAARGLGFAALFTNEIDAVKMLGRVRSFLGISKARQVHQPFPPDERPPYALEGEVDGSSWDKVRTHDDLMATAMRFYRFGAKRKSFSVTEDTIVRVTDLVTSPARPDPSAPIETPVTFFTPFGDVQFTLAAWRADGDTRAWRCICPRDPDGPADQEHDINPGCPRHLRRHG